MKTLNQIDLESIAGGFRPLPIIFYGPIPGLPPGISQPWDTSNNSEFGD